MLHTVASEFRFRDADRLNAFAAHDDLIERHVHPHADTAMFVGSGDDATPAHPATRSS